ncbi:MAG: Rrf2 family transcriptional regulator [bacterium]|nr:Rrf2 family transcriptional regulator [bacterium]
MKLSTRGRYAVRLVMDLAMNEGESPILLKDVAHRQEISEKYLWQLVPPLKTAGLLTVRRGARGGYSLSRPIAEITMKDVICAVEGPLCLVDCVDNPTACVRSASCASRDFWNDVSEVLLNTLQGVTLESLVEKQKEKSRTYNTYSI